MPELFRDRIADDGFLSAFVESYRFWDIVTLWARERLEHEDIVASALARGVIRDGLRLQSVDPRWVKGDDAGLEFRGYPFIGFRASPDAPMCILRAEALEHLLAVVRAAERASRRRLAGEFVSRADFRIWANAQGIALPAFWFANDPAVA